MNNIIKAGVRACVSRLGNPSKCIISTGNKRVVLATPAYSRTLWHMCSSHSKDGPNDSTFLKPKPAAELCHCGCKGFIHTNGERELVDFLKDEIVAERKAQKKKTLPTELDGFAVKTDEAELTFTKESPHEKITISINVNHSVDTDHEPEVNPTADKPDIGEMKSKPNFEVDIIRKEKTLSFSCSFAEPTGEPGEDGFNDVFGIDEVTIFEGEWNDKIYAVSGDVLDGYLYDLLMTVLEEKGISNEFVEKLSDFATSYEHSKYIALLESLNKFASTK